MATFRKIAVLMSGLMTLGTIMAQDAPAPAPAANSGAPAGVDNRTYIIGPQDVLRILVYEKGELSGPVVVQPDGTISLPLINEYIKAEGLTPDQLKTRLTEAWKANINSPEVTVSVVEVRSKTYRIMGYVNKPGTVSITHPVHISEAIADSLGFQPYADQKDIRITRDGGKIQLKFNWKDFLKGKNLDKDILLENGDIIEVHD